MQPANDSSEQQAKSIKLEGDRSERRIKNRDTERHVFVIWNLGVLGFILTNVDKKLYIIYMCGKITYIMLHRGDDE